MSRSKVKVMDESSRTQNEKTPLFPLGTYVIFGAFRSFVKYRATTTEACGFSGRYRIDNRGEY